jgi:hypothetical protein
LERQTPKVQLKSKALGLGGVKSVLEIKGDKSPIRFKEGQQLEFVVLVSSQQTDPQGILQLFSLDSLNGKRQLILGKEGLTSAGPKSVVNDKAVPFNATKYGTSSFKMRPAQNLPPGEYVLGTKDTTDGFCFAVDAAPLKQ